MSVIWLHALLLLLEGVACFVILPIRNGNDIVGHGARSNALPLNYQNEKIHLSSANSAIRKRNGLNEGSEKNKGARITLVGSGPGDPDLLTVAAYRIISDPEILCIADRLVSEEILNLVRGELRVVRKAPGCQEQGQDEIFNWVKEGVRKKKHVVRLKIGDPFVFGRGGEEVLKFREMGVEPKVIPGVSAAFSAPLLANIPVTHRGVSNQVVMCTGYGRNNTSPDLIQYHKEQTVVFLMAVGRLRKLSFNLCHMAKYPKDTPVAVVEKAGCPEQRTLVGTLHTIADLAEEHQIKPPSTIIVGEVVNVLHAEERTFPVHDVVQHALHQSSPVE